MTLAGKKIVIIVRKISKRALLFSYMFTKSRLQAPSRKENLDKTLESFQSLFENERLT